MRKSFQLRTSRNQVRSKNTHFHRGIAGVFSSYVRNLTPLPLLHFGLASVHSSHLEDIRLVHTVHILHTAHTSTL